MDFFTSIDEFVEGRPKTAGLGTIIRDVVAVPHALARLDIAKATESVAKHPWLWGGGAAGALAVHGGLPLLHRQMRQQDQDEAFATAMNDELLADADPEAMVSTFGTLRSFAPNLATDPNIVRSFLREAATSGGGINYSTIGVLAKTERDLAGQE